MGASLLVSVLDGIGILIVSSVLMGFLVWLTVFFLYHAFLRYGLGRRSPQEESLDSFVSEPVSEEARRKLA